MVPVAVTRAPAVLAALLLADRRMADRALAILLDQMDRHPVDLVDPAAARVGASVLLPNRSRPNRSVW